MSSEDASSLSNSLQDALPPGGRLHRLRCPHPQPPAGARSLPVRDYNVYALPFNQPLVTEVLAENGPGTPIVSSKKLVLRGLHLRGDERASC